VITIILLNLLCLAMIVEMLGMGMPVDWSSLLRRQAYQLLISFFLIWTAGWIQRPRVFTFTCPLGLEPADHYVRALEYAQAQLLAPAGALCWAGQDQASCNAATIGLLGGDRRQKNYCPSGFSQQLAGPAMFDLKRDRCIALSGGSLIKSRMTADEREFADRFGIEQGIYIPMSAASGSGRVVLGIPNLAGVDILRFAKEIGIELARSFDNQGYFRSVEEIATVRARSAIARDLHDNVAQSLAGTRFMLDSLRARSKRGEAIDDDLRKLSELLRSEHAQVNGTIEDLQKPLSSTSEELVGELKSLAEIMAQHWQVVVELAKHPARLELPADLVHNLKAIVREAISNAVRHGQASKVLLEVGIDENELKLVVINDGRAFESEETRPKSIQARVDNLSGRLDIMSRTGETRILISIPFGER